MKGLIVTSLIIALLIIAGMGVSIFITTSLINRLDAASQQGLEAGYAQGYTDGLQEGSGVGYQEGSKRAYLVSIEGGYDDSAGDGFYFTYNPGYDEVREVLAEVGPGSVEEIHDYAEANGIRAAYVRVLIAREAPEGTVYTYQLVAFDTADRGLVIIEPWSFEEVRLDIGKSYRELNGRLPAPYDDTITKFNIIW